MSVIELLHSQTKECADTTLSLWN